MPHSQARNGIKFINGLQLQTSSMSASCDIGCCNEKINHRWGRVVHDRFSQLSFDFAHTDVFTGVRFLRIHARGWCSGLIHFGWVSSGTVAPRQRT